MKTASIYLKSIKRRFPGFFPLSSIGMIENHPYCSVSDQGKLEFCIRLASTEFSSRERFGGREYLLKYPNVAIKLPDVKHEFSVTHPRDLLFFSYSPELTLPMQRAGLMVKSEAWNFNMTAEINHQLHRIREMMKCPESPGIADKLDLMAVQLLESLILEKEGGIEEKGYIEARIKRAAAWLQQHFTEEFDYAELAENNSFSLRNFFRCWKKYYSETPAQYVKQLKMTEAERLLKETDIPVERIVQMVGYRTAGYFSREFFLRYHETPLKFRRSHRNGNIRV